LEYVPKPNRQDSIVNRHDADANPERDGGFAKAGVFALPMPRAENDHEDGEDGRNGSDEADVVGHGLTAHETQSLARCTAEQASSKHHAQPCYWRQHANHESPAILHVKQQDQERHINDGLVEMKQEELRFEMGEDRETDNLQGRDGSDISIWSHRHSPQAE